MRKQNTITPTIRDRFETARVHAPLTNEKIGEVLCLDRRTVDRTVSVARKKVLTGLEELGIDTSDPSTRLEICRILHEELSEIVSKPKKPCPVLQTA